MIDDDMALLSPSMKSLITGYVDQGWVNAAALAAPVTRTSWAYLIIASRVLVPPMSEVQITTRCQQVFRGDRLVVGSEATKRFDLLDLRVGNRSQRQRDEILALRGCVGEANPELIQWPLEVCRTHVDLAVRAIIPERDEYGAGDRGATFELLLLGVVGGTTW